MDTNQIKKFAIDARNKLKQGVEAKILKLGFSRKGEVEEGMAPELLQGGSIWNGQTMSESFYHQWMSLYNRVQQVGIKEVYEEAAYTWFNRLMAIRILRRNNLIEPVLEYVGQSRMPKIVDDARTGVHIPNMTDRQRERLRQLLDDDTKVTEQFALLIVAWCHDNPIINSCFGSIADYTELLLPDNILSEGGFMDDINHTDFITDEDYHSPELIGWLYQFYISERKDEVFAKKGKFEADEIAPATQIFTPNWIVKYMVQNTIGRIYLDNHPEAESVFKPKWEYLVDQPKTEPQNVCKVDELTDLRCGDLACGSGHILNESFDLLYDLYIYEGYSRGEAVENIFQRNLTGIDIDQRAMQLATFALLLKACQKDSTFTDAHVLPNVMSMPVVNEYSWKDLSWHFINNVQDMKPLPRGANEEITQCFHLMRDTQTLGSIVKFDISETTRQWMQQAIDAYYAHPCFEKNFEPLVTDLKIILALTDKYDALVMNPPYMGSGNMNKVLSDYVKKNYVEGKADLATSFVQMMPQHLVPNGKYAFIIPPSWMFLSNFESLRKDIIENNSIDSLLHLSRGVFGADFGSASSVITNAQPKATTSGTYFRLVERTFQEFNQDHLRILFEKTLADHSFKYKFKDYDKSNTEFPCSEDGNNIYYPNVEQSQFEKIPGCPIGYWCSQKIFSGFAGNLALSA
ncbi:MAG: BREX-1 system adenine-specific DNA-methyltransferase PglX, partial [Prevotella sp.]